MEHNSGKNTGNTNKEKDYEETFLHQKTNNRLQPSETLQHTDPHLLQVR